MDAYRQKRCCYSDISGSLQLSTLSSGTITLAVPPGDAAHIGFYTIFIQKLYGAVTVLKAGATWTFKDTAGVPVYVVPTDLVNDTASPLVAPSLDQDFGAWGIGLTAGASLQLVISAGGAAGSVSWEGYAKLASVSVP